MRTDFDEFLLWHFSHLQISQIIKTNDKSQRKFKYFFYACDTDFSVLQ